MCVPLSVQAHQRGAAAALRKYSLRSDPASAGRQEMTMVFGPVFGHDRGAGRIGDG